MIGGGQQEMCKRPAPPGTSGMAPESCQEAEEAKKEAPLSLVGQALVNGPRERPAGTLQDPVAPKCPQDTKPSSSRVVFSTNLQLTPESLDPRALRLLWGQRELEIQALRWAIQNRPDARHCHVLQEVAGIPPERGARNQERFLQNKVQKLTLELKKQKEQAQLEKSQLEERLLQTATTIQQLEAELQAFQKSCLLQLARSSWVGRILRSSTGSVEVVTAETLLELSDLPESDQGPSAGEGFRLEDVDWNSIAQRYPNLFTNIECSSDQKHPRPLSPPEASLSGEWGSELRRRHMEQRLKSVEWSTLPLVGTSSSGGTDSGSSSGQLAARCRVRKVTGRPPRSPGRKSSEPTEAHSRIFSREMQTQTEGLLSPDLRKAHQDQPGKTVLTGEPCAGPEHGPPRRRWSPTGSCLKIIAVSRRDRFVRVLNQSLEETVDLSGLTLQQLVQDFPVCMYRFPPGTLLAPRHHVTVWGEGPRSTKKQLPSSLGFHFNRGCVTLLLNPKGEVLSEYQAPHGVSRGSRIFVDNADLSIDRFPLPEAAPASATLEQMPGTQHSRAGRAREPRARQRRPRPLPSRTALPSGGGLRVSRRPRPTGTRGPFPRQSASKLFRPPEATGTRAPERLPAIPETGLCLEDRQARKEPRVLVCRKTVDRSCPMVALSVQSTAESRFGFRFLPCPPVTAGPNVRV
ncbi:lamin tail domain-containing protein 2 isoform X1 [Canis lupus baileyi]|nr:lamin tail domain-containing protein 2 isoform X1 [Canis lupus dingo]XP_038279938.1 lamin tail domain-containing protein 2 isoform X1 [Canis lupus familiaris]XP_038279939.1 lamin tail domain-containing protein 2 isoform X1 [Canis lupus familiaris]XP_038279940.1 lamin tail domain-containing protein 2 isoform X1 [Canis lupus familiaris]XP_038310016.1 lamin tail domain-containing protein 2 isoform X1 [Canis lupus familiaris]XP_038310017.1 lamin tail domain-containing protein 2 isoform X1 [Cani